jgi:hypothetical protein
LEEIKEKKIQPKPKWEFLLKEYLIWVFGIGSLLVGGLAFSVIIHMSITNDWDVYEYINNSLVSFILATLPYFWLMCLGIFIALAYYNFKHTKSGYHYQIHALVLVSVISSILLGGVFYSVGLGRTLDVVFSENVPAYHQFMNHRRALWKHPEKGLLAGIITEKNGDDIKVKDFDGKTWSISLDDIIFDDDLDIEKGSRVRLIGRVTSDGEFKAERLMPWVRRTLFFIYPTSDRGHYIEEGFFMNGNCLYKNFEIKDSSVRIIQCKTS